MYFILKTHTALGISLFLFIFSVLFKLRNEIFQGAKTEWSFTWMHQVLMNKIWTLGGTKELLSLRLSHVLTTNTCRVDLQSGVLVAF